MDGTAHPGSSVLVALTTGRGTYRRVVDSLRHNIEHWRPAVSRVDLLVNFDTTYQSSTPEHFTVPPPRPLTDSGTVFYADRDFITRAEWLADHEKRALASISPLSGFGQKKNACLFFAMRNGYDVVLFWDDDEFAQHVERSDGGNRWGSTDIVGAHITGEADVTFGYWTGYVSPIPDSFFERVGARARTALTAALYPITDVVEESTFFDRSATYHVAAQHSLPRTVLENSRGGKWISGGNLGLRRSAALAGRLPAFYTPTDSRGDDSVYSTGLSNATVMRVPAAIYHDAFSLLDDTDFRRPYVTPKDRRDSGEAVARFANVLRGWLAYAPVLTVLRGEENALELVQECAGRLKACDVELVAYFGPAWRWAAPSVLLQRYLASVEDELQSFHRAQRSWRELCGISATTS